MPRQRCTPTAPGPGASAPAPLRLAAEERLLQALLVVARPLVEQAEAHRALRAVGLGLDHVGAARLDERADLAGARHRLRAGPAHGDLVLPRREVDVRDLADLDAVDREDPHFALGRAPGAHHRGVGARRIGWNARRLAGAGG